MRTKASINLRALLSVGVALLLLLVLPAGGAVAKQPASAGGCGTSAHPSGNDRCTESGGSDTQGSAPSDPDDDGHGPERSAGESDKPGDDGGVNTADQDGNNGCGNDQDFEDDNEGLCGGNAQAKRAKRAKLDERAIRKGGAQRKDLKAVKGAAEASVRKRAFDGVADIAGTPQGPVGRLGPRNASGPLPRHGVAGAAGPRSVAPAGAVVVPQQAGVGQIRAALAATGAPAAVLAGAALFLIGVGTVTVRRGRRSSTR